MQDHAATYYDALGAALAGPCRDGHEALIGELITLRRRFGRLFVLGVGGGAANAAHAVCDFRKLCGIEAYAPTDGVAEITARTNDAGWRTIFTEWLRTSWFSSRDAILVLSVGGGHEAVSPCIYDAVLLAHSVGAPILGIVGRPDGATAIRGHAVIVTGGEGRLLTPVAEAAQIAVLHALVSDARLQRTPTKW